MSELREQPELWELREQLGLQALVGGVGAAVRPFGYTTGVVGATGVAGAVGATGTRGAVRAMGAAGAMGVTASTVITVKMALKEGRISD